MGMDWSGCGARMLPSPGIPADTFWMEGHDGQITAIIPSHKLIVVRLGLTPVRHHYQPEPLLKALLEATNSLPHEGGG